MSASAELYAEAARVERQAAFTDHTTWRRVGEVPPAAFGAIHDGCFRCHLEAKARLHVRAGDAAFALETR